MQVCRSNVFARILKDETVCKLICKLAKSTYALPVRIFYCCNVMPEEKYMHCISACRYCYPWSEGTIIWLVDSFLREPVVALMIQRFSACFVASTARSCPWCWMEQLRSSHGNSLAGPSCLMWGCFSHSSQKLQVGIVTHACIDHRWWIFVN